MAERDSCDALVVGSGPNGLAAAITLAATGRSVRVFEADLLIGGGARSAELTLPGFVNDICSTSFPLALSSPFFRHQPLEKHGLEWLFPAAPLAHPFDDGTAVVLERSIQATAEQLGPDAQAYVRLMEPLAAHWLEIADQILGPLRPPRHPLVLARFGLDAIRSGRGLAQARFKGERARALVAGLATHAVLPLEQPPSAAFILVMGLAGHVVGWPFARGGAQRITDALVSRLRSFGGKVVAGRRVQAIEELPPARAVLFEVTPRQFVKIAGDRLPAGYRRALEKYRYGPGVFKMDWALDGPIPWRAPECLRGGTVHVGGTLEEIAASERAAWEGKIAEKPFVIAGCADSMRQRQRSSI
jgi:phytoene dehydrogenase-like protein